MKKVVVILIFVFLLFIVHCSYSQNPQWKYFYCVEGVSGMAEDSNYMWITTGNGLFKIDKISGNILNDYHTWNSQIPSNINGPIIIDDKGKKWISNVGLVKYDGSNFTLYNQDDSVLYVNGVTAYPSHKVHFKLIYQDINFAAGKVYA